MHRSLILAILAAVATLQTPATAQTTSRSFAALTAAGSTSALALASMTPTNHTVSLTVTGSPTTCTAALEGTIDAGATWYSLSGDQDCTASLMFHVAFRPVLAVRVTVSALSGGTSPAVRAVYLGVK